MHIKLTNSQPEKYSIRQLRRDNPQVSFPANIPDATLAEYSVYPLTAIERPTGDVVTEGVPAFNEAAKRWEQTWDVRAFTEEEIAQRLQNKREDMQVSMRQARLALLQQGLLSQVEAAIAAMDEPAKSAVQIEWEYAHVVDRTSPWISEMSVALGLTDEQMDGLFELAATL